MVRRGMLGVALALAAQGGVLPAAGSAPQDPDPRYSAALLDGASFDQRVRTTMRTEAGGPARTETVSRDARLEFRAVDSAGVVRIEAWFDSLVSVRDGPEGRLAPDTDALIGGRFRGWLTPEGRYTSAARPFIPDELSEVSDLGATMDDLLPRLPDTGLAVGGRWDDGPLRIVRRADSTARGVTLARYRWSRVTADTTTEYLADSLPYQTRIQHREEGDLVWHPRLGPLVWRRASETNLEIPMEGAVRRPARTRVNEESWVWRRIGVPPGA